MLTPPGPAPPGEVRIAPGHAPLALHAVGGAAGRSPREEHPQHPRVPCSALKFPRHREDVSKRPFFLMLALSPYLWLSTDTVSALSKITNLNLLEI